jgi:DNA-binding NarL/FixJ family response regulator
VDAVLAAAGAGVPSRRARKPSELSGREVEVVRALAHGLSNKEIARRLDTSPKTVDNQVQSIYQKLGVRTRAGATLAAMERSLL